MHPSSKWLDLRGTSGNTKSSATSPAGTVGNDGKASAD